MQPVIQTYKVKLVREGGNEPISGLFYSYAEQEFEVDATSRSNAYKLSHLLCEIQFRGQTRRTFINGEEYFNERY